MCAFENLSICAFENLSIWHLQLYVLLAWVVPSCAKPVANAPLSPKFVAGSGRTTETKTQTQKAPQMSREWYCSRIGNGNGIDVGIGIDIGNGIGIGIGIGIGVATTRIVRASMQEKRHALRNTTGEPQKLLKGAIPTNKVHHEKTNEQNKQTNLALLLSVFHWPRSHSTVSAEGLG